MTALKMLTINVARFMGEEDELGSLEPGKWADLSVLSGDLITVTDTEIDTLKIDQTYTGGKLVFDASLWEGTQR